MAWVEPVELVGRAVRLRPMRRDDAELLFEAASDPDLWKWTLVTAMETRADLDAYLESAFAAWDRGTDLPFVIEHLESGRCAGSTRYLDIRPAHKALEIGWTWVTRDFQRTRVNTECKYLLLKHAFETLGANRVQLKTDALNERSRNAILRLGARFEGILRAHSITDTGRVRDTAYYGIIREEWPDVKRRLETILES